MVKRIMLTIDTKYQVKSKLNHTFHFALKRQIKINNNHRDTSMKGSFMKYIL